MSNLSKQIQARIQNTRSAVLEPYNITTSLEYSTPVKTYTDVKFTAELGVSYRVADSAMQVAIPEILQAVKLSVIEKVFGEFRAPLQEIKHHLYNRDIDSALKAVQDLEVNMFHV